MEDADVVHVPEENRYELRLGGRRVGLIAYRSRDDALDLTHTEVEPQLEGRGLGSRLVAGALDDARARGVKVVPSCPFIADFIERNPEYADVKVSS